MKRTSGSLLVAVVMVCTGGCGNRDVASRVQQDTDSSGQSTIDSSSIPDGRTVPAAKGFKFDTRITGGGPSPYPSPEVDVHVSGVMCELGRPQGRSTLTIEGKIDYGLIDLSGGNIEVVLGSDMQGTFTGQGRGKMTGTAGETTFTGPVLFSGAARVDAATPALILSYSPSDPKRLHWTWKSDPGEMGDAKANGTLWGPSPGDFVIPLQETDCAK